MCWSGPLCELGKWRAAVLLSIGLWLFASRCAVGFAESGAAEEAVRKLELRVDELQAEVRSMRSEQAEFRRRLDFLARIDAPPQRSTGNETDEDEAPAWATAMESSINANTNTAIDTLRSEMVPQLGEAARDADSRLHESLEDGGNIINVDVKNTDWLKEVMFGGSPWVLYCDDKKDTERAQPPAIFQESALQLKEMATFGKLDCWERTSAGKTLAHRFDFPKAPVVFAVANGDPPMVLDLDGLTKPWQLRRKVQSYLSVSIPRIDSPKTFKSACASRRACLIVGFTTAPMLAEALSVLQPVLEENRAVRAVSVDTSVWKVGLDSKLAATKPKKKDGQKERAYMVCIARRSGSQSRAGAFLRVAGGGAPTRENLEVFLDRCASGKNLVGMSSAPQISLRPPEKPKPYYPPPTPSPSTSGKAGKPAAKRKAAPTKGAGAGRRPRPQQSNSGEQGLQRTEAHSKPRDVGSGRKQDHVGSRQSLEEEEPLFSVVEDSADDSPAPEDESEDDGADEEVEL